MPSPPPEKRTSPAREQCRSALNADVITRMVADGETVAACCRMLGIDRRDLYRWIADDAEFAAAMEEARSAGYDAIAEKVLEIADDASEHPLSRRIRTDSRLKLLAKWHPKKYGEKLEVEQTNRNATLDIPADMDASEAARRYQDFVRGT